MPESLMYKKHTGVPMIQANNLPDLSVLRIDAFILPVWQVKLAVYTIRLFENVSTALLRFSFR